MSHTYRGPGFKTEDKLNDHQLPKSNLRKYLAVSPSANSRNFGKNQHDRLLIKIDA